MPLLIEKLPKGFEKVLDASVAELVGHGAVAMERAPDRRSQRRLEFTIWAPTPWLRQGTCRGTTDGVARNIDHRW